MTTVTFTLTEEPPPIEEAHPHPGLAAKGQKIRRDGVNKLFADNGPFTVEARRRRGLSWSVDLSGDLNAGQKTALTAALEASGYCTGVAFP